MKATVFLLVITIFSIGAALAFAGNWWEKDQTPPPLASPPMGGRPTGSGDTAGMVKVPGGTFLMGCSTGDEDCWGLETRVRLTSVKGFWMDATPVTQDQYQSVMGTNPSYFRGCPDCPVEKVSWEDAQSFCDKAGKRLPTEAEWEYAARGGTKGARYGDLDAIAWYSKNSNGGAHPVGEKQPNAYGLYDMLGNVWEWCADWFDADHHALRGGCWDSGPRLVRVSARTRFEPASWTVSVGFRCAKD